MNFTTLAPDVPFSRLFVLRYIGLFIQYNTVCCFVSRLGRLMIWVH